MDEGDREILDCFVQTREKTIQLAQIVPDELLGRTPDGERQLMARLLCHAGCSGAWWMYHVMNDGGEQSQPWLDERDAILDALRDYRDRVVSFFSADDGAAMSRVFSYKDEDGTETAWTGRNRVLYFISHEIHHRGKIVLALRQWDFDGIPFLPF